MVKYYDFLTGYENILRDGGEFIGIDASCNDGKTTFNRWPPVINQVSVVGKRFESFDVAHLINFTNATHLDWCDTNANQGEPTLFKNIAITIPAKTGATSVWMASPDYKDGVAINLPFSQKGNDIEIVLPEFKYWNMVVVEY